ncbi:MAG: hypothetical protein ABJN22_02410 [Litorimonas sp.]
MNYIDPTGQVIPLLIFGAYALGGYGIFRTSEELTKSVLSDYNNYGFRGKCWNWADKIRILGGQANPAKKLVSGARQINELKGFHTLQKKGSFALRNGGGRRFKEFRNKVISRTTTSAIWRGATGMREDLNEMLEELNFNDNCECQDESSTDEPTGGHPNAFQRWASGL